RIRAAFLRVEAFAKSRALEAEIAAVGVPFSINEITAMNLEGGPLSLQVEDQCWTLAPAGGKRSVNVTLTIDVPVALRGATISEGSCGAAGSRYIVEQKAMEASSWTPLADCNLVPAAMETPSCLFDLRAPRQLRFKIIADKPISLANLRLY